MQAFELYFNPKRDDLFLMSFVYTPTNVYEQRLGNLYVVGELTQALPQNSHLLTNLSLAIKREYYASGLKRSCEASLQEALKKGNEFLSQESKRGNVGWLGNLSFSVISFKEPDLIFTKAGNLKIFLVRANEVMDLSQNLENTLAHPDPLKIFGNIAEGKISSEDKIIILNKKILTLLGKKQKFLGELGRASNEKELKQVLKLHQDVLNSLSGVCLVLMASGKDGAKQTVTLQNSLPNFSFSANVFKPFLSPFVKIWKRPKIKFLPKINLPKLKKPKLPKLPKVDFMAMRKKLFLVGSLILILLAFYYIFHGERIQELKNAQTQLTEARSKAALAESLLILKKDDQAKTLFEETLNILYPLTKRGSPLRDDALFLQNSVKQQLK